MSENLTPVSAESAVLLREALNEMTDSIWMRSATNTASPLPLEPEVT